LPTKYVPVNKELPKKKTQISSASVNEGFQRKMLPFQQVLNTNVMREEIYGDSVDKDMAAKECVPAHQSFE